MEEEDTGMVSCCRQLSEEEGLLERDMIYRTAPFSTTLNDP